MNTTSLWWKSFFLLPPWAFLLLPIIGALTFHVGSAAFQIGYMSVLVWGIFNFSQELLRRKIKIDDDFIYFGYQKYKLSELSSIGLVYDAMKIVPNDVLLYFGEGKKLQLSLNKLTFEQFQIALNLIENRVPNCDTDPVLISLIKSKKLARRAAFDETDRTEFEYHSARVISEFAATFRGASESWSRLGPVVVSCLMAPAWLVLVFSWFKMGATTFESKESFDTLQTALISFFGAIDFFLAQALQAGTTAMFQGFSNPLVSLLMLALVAPFLWRVGRMSFGPNRLLIDENGVRLVLKLAVNEFPVSQINWSNVRRARLSKPSEKAGPEQWLIRLEGDLGQTFDLELAAINVDDRMRLNRAIERWAPSCTIESDLAETLLPKQANSYTELWLQSLAAPPERASLEPLTHGRVLRDGEYDVIKRIGVGGQGAAYLCNRRVQTNPAETELHQVVLKETILPVFVESAIRAQALERFEQEARILKSLDSEYVVKLLDYFVEDHRGYLVLELIDGKSLRQVVEERGGLPEEMVLDLCQQMCQILSYLHGQSVIHRDFTPDNLIMRKDGKLKLIDFNVAQQEGESTSDVVVGKHSYLPPEQFRGRPTLQSDIYAMGATLFYLLTGEDPEPIAQSNPTDTHQNVSALLDKIIKKSTALDCSKRYQSVQEVLQEFAEEQSAQEESESVILSTKTKQAEPIKVDL